MVADQTLTRVGSHHPAQLSDNNKHQPERFSIRLFYLNLRLHLTLWYAACPFRTGRLSVPADDLPYHLRVQDVV